MIPADGKSPYPGQEGLRLSFVTDALRKLRSPLRARSVTRPERDTDTLTAS